jgi:hypothetical protein
VSSIAVDIHGAVGSGKTVVVSSLLKALDEQAAAPGSKLVFGLSKGMQMQLMRIEGGTTGDRTPPIMTDVRAMRIDDAQASASTEKIEVSLDGKKEPDIHIGAFAGESLTNLGGGYSPAEMASRYNEDQTRLLVAVFNPYNWNQDVARRAVFSMTARLIEKLGLTLYEAIITSVRQIFGTHESQVSGAIPPPEHLRHGANEVGVVAPDLKMLCEAAGNVRIHFDPTETRDARRMFPAELESTTDETVSAVEEVYLSIERIVQAASADRMAANRALMQVVRTVETSCVVCLTHLDLKEWTPAVTDEDFEKLEETLGVAAVIGARSKILLKQIAYRTEFTRHARKYAGENDGAARKPQLTALEPLMGRAVLRNVIGRFEELRHKGILSSKDAGVVPFSAGGDEFSQAPIVPDYAIDSTYPPVPQTIPTKSRLDKTQAEVSDGYSLGPTAPAVSPAVPASSYDAAPIGPHEKMGVSQVDMFGEGVYTGLLWFGWLGLAGGAAAVGLALASKFGAGQLGFLPLPFFGKVAAIGGLVALLLLSIGAGVIRVMSRMTSAPARWQFVDDTKQDLEIRGIGSQPIRVPWDQVEISSTPLAESLGLGWIGPDRITGLMAANIDALCGHLSDEEEPIKAPRRVWLPDLRIVFSALFWLVGVVSLALLA